MRLKIKIKIISLLNYLKLKYLIFSTLGLYFFSILTLNMSGIAGYNINDNLALVDRYIKTKRFFYSGGPQDFFVGTPSYFPGNAFLLYLIRIFTYDYAVEAASLVSAIWIILFISLLLKKSVEITSDKLLCFTILPLFIITFFPAWVWYAIDSKPDTLLLFLFLAITIILEKKSNIYFKTISLFCFGIFGTLIKQQFLILFISTLFYTYFVDKSNFIKRFIPLFLGGLIGIIILFSIENLPLYTIQIQKQRHFQPLKNILNMCLTVFKNSWIIFILFFFYLKFLRKKTPTENGLLIAALIWFFMSFLSAIHIGGTVENLYSGLLLTLPFVIGSISYIFNYSDNLKITILKNASIILFIISIISIGGNFLEANLIRNKKLEIVQYINLYFHKKNTLYDGSTYSIVRSTNLNPTSEIDVVMNFESAFFDTSLFYKQLQKGKYDVIVTSDDRWRTNSILSKIIKDYFILDKAFETRSLKVFIFKFKNVKSIE